MSRRLHTRGEYATDGKQRRHSVREASGHRCIRCHHPFETGKHGTHGGPIFIDDHFIEKRGSSAGFYVSQGRFVKAQWRILTVHHLDGDKANDAWWNTLALCQRCHLTIQSRVDPQTPWFLEHSEWFKPYVAGFYAWKYEGRMLSREEVEARLVELLKYECRTEAMA